MPFNAAGRTRVSLNTRWSPADRMSGSSRTVRSSRAPLRRTTRRRAASCGSAGRRAIRRSGRSKSNASRKASASLSLQRPLVRAVNHRSAFPRRLRAFPEMLGRPCVVTRLLDAHLQAYPTLQRRLAARPGYGQAHRS